MLSGSLLEASFAGWPLFTSVVPVCLLLLILTRAIYNLWFHPLANVPGPFWARVSGIPSWLQAFTGKRHIWLWQLSQTYGHKIRVTPNTVIFSHPTAHSDIYGMRSNVRRSLFYSALARKANERTTLNAIDVHEHARKRRLLATCFTETSTRTASEFAIKHVDRWHQLLFDEYGTSGWSKPFDISAKIDALVFDIMGDLSFGKSFDIKEPGDHPLKAMPHAIEDALRFYYPMCRSPFARLLVWLKPHGLDALSDMVVPPSVANYSRFVEDSLTDRIRQYKEDLEVEKPEKQRRRDMAYYLCDARDPDTGDMAYEEGDLRAEAGLLVVAGSDTSATSLSGIFFYLTGDQVRLQKLADEVRTAFASADDIVYGPGLMGCTYLKACVDEGMRLMPAAPCELPREVLPGGLLVMGEYYPEGTIVGTAQWVDSRSTDVYGDDADKFRPERWIADEATDVTKESVLLAKRGFHPFLSGATSCLGKNVAMSSIMITVARTVHRINIRRAPGSTLGCGAPELGWGASDRNQMQLEEAFISMRKGPEVQFKRRA